MRLTIATGQSIPPLELGDRLEQMGFTRVSLVQGVGEYALRGGILDLFGFGSPDPVRIEFWGDEVASIRRFDILDQRSTGDLERVEVLPVDLRAAQDGARADAPVVRRSLLDVLPRDAIVVELEPDAAPREIGRTWNEVLRLHRAAIQAGDGEPEPPDALFLPPDDATSRLAGFGRLRIGADGDLRFDIRPAEPIDRDMDRLTALLRAGAARGCSPGAAPRRRAPCPRSRRPPPGSSSRARIRRSVSSPTTRSSAARGISAAAGASAAPSPSRACRSSSPATTSCTWSTASAGSSAWSASASPPLPAAWTKGRRSRRSRSSTPEARSSASRSTAWTSSSAGSRTARRRSRPACTRSAARRG